MDGFFSFVCLSIFGSNGVSKVFLFIRRLILLTRRISTIWRAISTYLSAIQHPFEIFNLEKVITISVFCIIQLHMPQSNLRLTEATLSQLKRSNRHSIHLFNFSSIPNIFALHIRRCH